MADEGRNPLGIDLNELLRGIRAVRAEFGDVLDDAAALDVATNRRIEAEREHAIKQEATERRKQAGGRQRATAEEASAARRARYEREMEEARRRRGPATFADALLGGYGGPRGGGGLPPRVPPLDLQRLFGPSFVLPGQGRVGASLPSHRAPLPYGLPHAFLEAMQSGGRFGPPPPPPPTAQGGPLYGDDDREGMRQQIRLADELEKENKKLHGSTVMLNEANRNAVPYWRRHGAMTSEFFEALGRGEVTLSELRWQMGITMAKFGGWLVAGAAIFAVVDAFREMGGGALDSLEGVNKLQRIIDNVDTEKAQTEFRNMSREFNLPIGDVAETAFGMSKIFGREGGLEATLTATQSALFAVKVGELEAGQATKFLTSIVQGFNLEASEMPRLFDTMNQAQNRFGGNLGQIIQGTANAAGAFDQLGGSYQDLIALLQTGTRVTGRTGSEIGTALRRSAEIITRPERRQRIIDLLGIDPRDNSITEVINRAMEVIREAPASQQRDLAVSIARTISTPELASGRILPILRASSLYRTIRGELEPGRVKGSAQTELEQALKGPREQIAALGVALEGLGSSLAQSGLLDPLLLLLKTVNATVRGVTDLVSLFSELPGPLRQAAVAALELAAAVKIISLLRGRSGGPTGGPIEATLVPHMNPNYAGATPVVDLGRQLGPTAVPPAYRGRLGDVNRKAVAFNQRMAALGVSGAVIGRTAQAGTRVATGVAGRLAQAGAGVRGWGGALGPLDSALLAFTAGFYIVDAMADRFERATDLINQLESRAGTMNADELRSAADKLREENNFWDAALDLGAEAGRFLTGIVKNIPGTEWRDSESPREAREAEAARLERDAATLDRVSGRGVRSTQAQIRARMLRRIRDARNRHEIEKALSDAERSADLSLAAQPGAKQGQRTELARTRDMIRARRADLAAGVQSLYEALQALNDVDSVEQFTQLLQNRVALEGMSGRTERAIGAEIARVRVLAASTENQDQKASYIQQIEQLESMLQEQAQRRLSRELEFARTPGEAQAARNVYLRALTRGRVRENERAITNVSRRLRQQREELRNVNEAADHFDRVARDAAQGPNAQEEPGGELRPGIGRQLPGESREVRRARRMAEASRDRARELRSAIRAGNRELEALRQELGLTKEEMRQIVHEQQKQQLELELAAFDARTSRLQSGNADPLAAARTLLSRMRERTNRIRQAFSRHLATQQQVDEQIAQENQALQQLAQERISDFQSRQELSSARFNVTASPEQSLRRSLSDAQRFAAFVRSQGRKVPPGTYRDALRAVYDAQKALQDFMEQQAQDMISAQAELALSRTEDPVKQAAIRLRESQKLLRYADTPAEKVRGLAEINNRRRELRQTRQREQYEQIGFELDIGRIERETALRRYEAMLKTLRGNRELRRELQRRIAQLRRELEQESEVELNVGNIRLPTVYDIRRLAAQGTSNQTQVRQSFVFQIDGAGDPDAVASAVVTRMAVAGDSGLRSAQRAAGLR